MTDRISKQPVIIDGNAAHKLNRIPLNKNTFDEKWLQGALEQTPSILPTAEIAPIFAPLICIAREVHVKTDDNKFGQIDNLYISKHGCPVIVETKLWRNPEAQRTVVGQILDYAKEIKDWDYEKINGIYRTYHNTNDSIFDAMVAAGYHSPESEADFIDTVNQNIRNAQFLLMIVGDGIRTGVEKIADYMNTNPDMHHRLALCELEIYDLGDGRRLIVPQLTTKTKIIERGIFRIENCNIKLHTPESEERASTDTERGPTITQGELIAAFTARNKNISTEQITSFLEDLADLGCYINYTPHGASVYCPVPSMQTSIQTFYIPGIPKVGREDTAAQIWFVPARILRRMDTLGLATNAAKRMFEAWRPLLAKGQKNTPYEDWAKFYFLDNTVITTPKKRSAFLLAIEEFKNSL